MAASSAGVGAPNTATDWFKDARYGVAQHILGDGSSPAAYQASIAAIDVEAIAGQLHEAGAGYYLLTLGQNNGYYCASNAAYTRYTGRSDCFVGRDLPMEFSNALQSRGIPLLLYFTCGAPSEDEAAARALGATEREPRHRYDWLLSETFRRRWSEVIGEWSDRYGERVSGWWFDGAFQWTGFDETYAEVYAAAAKHGNPDSILAFNPGVRPVGFYSAFDDYLAGEQNEPLSRPQSRWDNGKQWHTWTFLGSGWAEPDTRFDDQTWIAYLRAVTEREGVVTLDTGPIRDGTISPAQMGQLRAIKRVIREQA